MIPLRLKLNNFMSYGEEPTVLDFSGIRLACIAGDNGAGKSTVLEAMTWALWGKTRAKQDSELIHHGKSSMEVELEFALQGNEHRVRRRLDKTRAGLELHINDNGRWRNLSEGSIRETEAKINGILRMDYETFINSAFLAQGRADEFTTKRPAERKKILGEILGLSHYEVYEERAKEKARERAEEITRIEMILAEIQKELAKKADYEKELAAAESEHRKISDLWQAEEKRLEALRRSQQELDALEKESKELDKRIREIKDELSRLEGEISIHQEEIRRSQRILADEANIREGFAQFQSVREEDEHLNQGLDQYLKLEKERAHYQQVIEMARSEIQSEIRVLQERLAHLQDLAQKRPILEEGLANLRLDIAALNKAKEELAGLRQGETGARREIAALETQIQSLASPRRLLEDKIALLDTAHAQCPVCEQNLSEERRLHVQHQYHSQEQEIEFTITSHRSLLDRLMQEIQEYRGRMTALEDAIQKFANLESQSFHLSQELARAKEAEERRDKESKTLALLQERLAEEDFLLPERRTLEKIQEEIDRTGYDPQKHQTLKERLQALHPFEKKMAELEQVKEEILRRQEMLAKRQEDLNRWQERLSQEQGRIASLEARRAILLPEVERFPTQERVVRGLKGELEEVQRRLGVARAQIESLWAKEAEKAEKEQRLQNFQEEKAVYDELTLAFGKKGLPAMIIESAIPEIEEEANRILRRLTDGRMHVQFVTQRGTVRGEVAETMEIKISDEMGTRSYELYSGGEAFRINFAVRIALAKLLSRRAGAPLQTLIIDEGFGTLDTAGRERLVEAINSVQEEFQHILVITHLEELKDLFPVRIEVLKTLQGSRLAINS